MGETRQDHSPPPAGKSRSGEIGTVTGPGAGKAMHQLPLPRVRPPPVKVAAPDIALPVDADQPITASTNDSISPTTNDTPATSPSPIHSPVTPTSARRACRFPNFNEAHRNITGRSFASASTTHSSSFDTANERDTTAVDSWPVAHSANAHDVSRPVAVVNPITATDVAPSPYLPSTPMSRDNLKPISVGEDRSTSTVNRIYDHYRRSVSDHAVTPNSARHDATLDFDTSPRLGAPRSSSLDRLSPANLSALRSGAGARCGFRSDDGVEYSDDYSRQSIADLPRSTPPADQRSHEGSTVTVNPLWPNSQPSGDPPSASLPHLPTFAFFEHSEGRARNYISYGPSFSTIDSQGLLNGGLGLDGHGLVPSPLSVPLHSQANARLAFRRTHLSASGTSMGATTESDDDPFRYDKGTYGVFLVPKKEREVSADLQRLGSSTKRSRSSSRSPVKPLPKLAALPSPIPEHPSSDTDRFRDPRTQIAALQFLDPNAIKSSWELDEDGGAVIKVPVPPRKDSPRESNAVTGPKPTPKVGLSLPTGGSMAASDRDDWETVGTIRGAHDSSPYPPPVPPPKAPFGRSMHITGSSIADISDDEVSLYQAPFDEFGSTERIIQHPSRECDGQPFKIRHLKDSNIPVFVPKQRVHRVNGLAQNSIRMLQDHTAGSKDSGQSSLAGRIQNPFSVLNKKRKEKHLPLPPRPMPNLSRFEFRDSVYTENLENPFVEPRPRSRTGPSLRMNDGALSDDQDDSMLSTDMSNTSHNFAFPLIPLPEAARLQAIRRESGIDDQMFAQERPSKERSRKMSFASLKKNKGSAPAAPKMPRPPRNIHRRAPTPLFSPEMQRGYRNTDVERDAGLDDHISPISSRIDSPPNRSNRGSRFCDNSTATFGASPLKDQMNGMWPSRRSQIPRLYPWDERRMQPGSDPYLRALANRGRLPSAPLTYTSDDGRKKQRRWFLLMLLISIFPFLSVLVYFGKFDSALAWYSKGEVTELSPFQRRIILSVMIFQFFVWTAIIVLVVKKMGGAL